MPFNIITLVSTIMAFLLGSMINALVRTTTKETDVSTGVKDNKIVPRKSLFGYILGSINGLRRTPSTEEEREIKDIDENEEVEDDKIVSGG
jgi:hypothetical protein